jgi:3-oxoacyl-[acyl-carrier-protein] synthase III
MAEAYRGLMGLHEFDLQKINMLIPHQANPGAIMRDLATPLGIPEEKVWLGGRRVGNVAVACLPFGLDECIRGGRIKAGSAVALVAIGAGGNAWTGGASLWII